MSQTITEAFGVKPVNFYAASESIALGAQCDLHEGIHMFNDWHNFELVDKDLNAVEAGQPGKLLLTNLYNYTQPLIRYKMNDQLIFNDRPCACNSPFPTIKNIAGRQEDFLWFKKTDGSTDYIHPLLLAGFFVSGIEKFQFIQTAKNRLTIKAVSGQDKGKVTTAITDRMNEILSQKKLAETVLLNIELVDDLKVDQKTGKFKLVIPFNN